MAAELPTTDPLVLPPDRPSVSPPRGPEPVARNGSGNGSGAAALLGRPTPVLSEVVSRIGRNSHIGAVERRIRGAIAPVLRRDDVRAVIGEESPLGHPVHPVLTDLPIGFWTSALAVDVLVGRRGAPAARKLVGLGVLSAVPTALTGLSDYAALPAGPARRVSVVHAATNASATAMYAVSWSLRRRDRWLTGVLTSLMAAGLATVGGALGGSLAFDDQLSSDRRASPTD